MLYYNFSFIKDICCYKSFNKHAYHAYSYRWWFKSQTNPNCFPPAAPHGIPLQPFPPLKFLNSPPCMQDIATLKHPRGTTLLILHLLALHLTVLSLFCHGLDFVILIGEKIRLIKAPSTPSIPILRGNHKSLLAS